MENRLRLHPTWICVGGGFALHKWVIRVVQTVTHLNHPEVVLALYEMTTFGNRPIGHFIATHRTVSGDGSSINIDICGSSLSDHLHKVFRVVQASHNSVARKELFHGYRLNHRGVSFANASPFISFKVLHREHWTIRADDEVGTRRHVKTEKLSLV